MKSGKIDYFESVLDRMDEYQNFVKENCKHQETIEIATYHIDSILIGHSMECLDCGYNFEVVSEDYKTAYEDLED